VHEPSAPELQPDVAVEAHVVGHCGVDASRLEIMHLNQVCAYPDLSNLFIRADVTAQAHDALEEMPGVIQDQLAMLAGPLPDVAIGEHCRAPYECPFMARCWPALPPHHVSTLYSAGRRPLLLEEQGYATIRDLPEDIPLKAIQDRQRRAVQAGQLIVEPSLAAALRGFQPPPGLSGLRDRRPAHSNLERVPSLGPGARPVQLPGGRRRRPRHPPRMAGRGAGRSAPGAGTAAHPRL